MEVDFFAEKILILDFGSQYTQLIARRVREAKVYCEIHPFNMVLEAIKTFSPKGIILSGGPASIYDTDAPFADEGIFDLGIPVLGICYGMQFLTHLRGGAVAQSGDREYGNATMAIRDDRDLFHGFEKDDEWTVWMSHGDRIDRMPEGFEVLASSKNSPVAAMVDTSRRFFGVQFHPEVAHTPEGPKILANFLFHICGCEPSWTMASFVRRTVDAMRTQLGNERVICGLSGGVDSSVTAVLLHEAIGDNLSCILVDNGLLRKGEARKVVEVFQEYYGIDLHLVDASGLFLGSLKGVTDPEEKRKIIGREFIRCFEKKAAELGSAQYLAQGTLYPDVIESVSFKGPSATIKSHHNVGGLPEVMNLKLVEPLRELFKDEVREVGIELGLPKELVMRQPFPGPGLAIRILGEITTERLSILREADVIVLDEIKMAGLYEKVWQSFAVLLPVRTVGVMGDERTYEHVIAVRVVDSLDAMTADWSKIPYQVMGRISNRIINSVKGVNRVVYDISSKPPSTIEWEQCRKGVQEMERHLLVTVSEKHDNLFGVRFLGAFFAQKEVMKITLLYLTPKPPGRFEADRETELRSRKSEAVGRKALDEVKGELLKLGFKEEQISIRLRARRLSKVSEIIQEGSEGKYDAVVLGRRGLSWLEQAFDESVTQTLFEQPWNFPIWICRKPDPGRKDVLACVDGSDASQRMLDHVGFILGQAREQGVTLLAVSRKGKVGDRPTEDILAKSKENLVDDGVSPERIRFKVIPEANPGKAIIREARSRHFAAVAVGRTGTGMGLLKKVFVGSVSRTLFWELEGASLWLV